MTFAPSLVVFAFKQKNCLGRSCPPGVAAGNPLVPLGPETVRVSVYLRSSGFPPCSSGSRISAPCNRGNTGPNAGVAADGRSGRPRKRFAAFGGFPIVTPDVLNTPSLLVLVAAESSGPGRSRRTPAPVVWGNNPAIAARKAAVADPATCTELSAAVLGTRMGTVEVLGSAVLVIPYVGFGRIGLKGPRWQPNGGWVKVGRPPNAGSVTDATRPNLPLKLGCSG